MFGKPPVVDFQADDEAPCSLVVSEAYSINNVPRKVIEFKFRINVKLLSGSEDKLSRVIFTIQEVLRKDKKHTITIKDYLPKTEMVPSGNVVEPTIVVREEMISGTLSLGYETVAKAHAEGRIKSRYEYKMMPSLKLKYACGIIQGGSGIEVKLRPTEGQTLQGDNYFSLLIAVPKDWRGDHLRIKCQAFGHKRKKILKGKEIECGLAQSELALYLEDDLKARKFAASLKERQAYYLSEQAKQMKFTYNILKWNAVFSLLFHSILEHLGGSDEMLGPKVIYSLILDDEIDENIIMKFPPRLIDALMGLKRAKEDLKSLSGTI